MTVEEEVIAMDNLNKRGGVSNEVFSSKTSLRDAEFLLMA